MGLQLQGFLKGVCAKQNFEFISKFIVVVFVFIERFSTLFTLNFHVLENQTFNKLNIPVCDRSHQVLLCVQ